jgi:precorrin-6A/cobalt-precorrin-6A reductase
MNLLILGGTSEASALGRALADDARVRAVISLAGRTRVPLPQALPTRTGGFGGADGLAAYLRENRIDALIDATHPFAAQMTANAVAAAALTATKLLRVQRPPWHPIAGDDWTDVGTMAEAAAALGPAPRRVLLTVGSTDLAPFRRAPWHHYVVRSVDAPPADALPPRADVIAARGPFAEDDERRLLRAHAIDAIVTKNSGGSATEAKLAAARALRLPVIMVRRPPAPDVATVGDVAEGLAWLERIHTAPRRE